MNISIDDLNKNSPVFVGKANIKYVNGQTIYKLNNGQYYLKIDNTILGIFGFDLNVNLFLIRQQLILVFLDHNKYSVVSNINIIEDKIIGGFFGFSPGKRFKLRNGDIWEQQGGPVLNCQSSGSIIIYNESILEVDNWDINVFVKKIII